LARLRAGRIFFNLPANSTFLRANVPTCDARCHASRTRGIRCLRDALFAPNRLVGFFAQKNYRAYKPLPGMRRRGVEKRHAAEAFGQAPQIFAPRDAAVQLRRYGKKSLRRFNALSPDRCRSVIQRNSRGKIAATLRSQNPLQPAWVCVFF